MSTTGRLAGKTALITGAGSGLGRATALRFAEEGAAVACVDLNLTAAQAVTQEIRERGGRAIGLAADVSSSADSEKMVSDAIEQLGRVDILFANAGVAGTGNAADISEDLWDKVIDINLKGVWLSAKYVLPHMIERGEGVIINQASMGGLVGINGIFPYTAAKGGVIAMTKQMAVTYGPNGVRVNAICPGTIPTPLVYRSREERGDAPANADHSAKDAEVSKRFPLQRLGTPDDVANLALFLASDEANWVTGSIYAVDGGRSAA
ncbi:SDR family NAD(P)-dependent oxidoreductase [Rhodococcus sp. ARC_M6]|uniref:SDR family NAD(P)-dependent oxidoreductase n=1 Tax=Rhodococcus sp. ARC_M6 TaxID=2928852 RepID=UPI001FB1B3A1|nr:glucose 1-dehydrogenase [Rhodococcus sp. ARC_M6]MCJ0905425.1 glucose 1-dehydrogenase [Rhodococcus sp. ARC_M6]